MENFRKFRKVIATFFCLAAVVVVCLVDFMLPSVSKNVNMLASAIAFALFCASVCASNISGRLHIIKTLELFAAKLLILFIMVTVAFGISMIKTGNVWVDRILFFSYLTLVGIFEVVYYNKERQKWSQKAASSSVRKSAGPSGELKFLFTSFYASMLLAFLCQGALLVEKGNYLMILVLLASSIIAIAMWKVLKWRGWVLLFNVTSVLYLLKYTADSIGLWSVSHLPDFTVLVALYCAIVIPLFDLYTRRESFL